MLGYYSLFSIPRYVSIGPRAAVSTTERYSCYLRLWLVLARGLMTSASVRRCLRRWPKLDFRRSQERLIVASQGERHYSVSWQMKLLHFEHLTLLQNLAVVSNRWSGAYCM